MPLTAGMTLTAGSNLSISLDLLHAVAAFRPSSTATRTSWRRPASWCNHRSPSSTSQLGGRPSVCHGMAFHVTTSRARSTPASRNSVHMFSVFGQVVVVGADEPGAPKLSDQPRAEPEAWRAASWIAVSPTPAS